MEVAAESLPGLDVHDRLRLGNTIDGMMALG
jgi:hypothetical protein